MWFNIRFKGFPQPGTGHTLFEGGRVRGVGVERFGQGMVSWYSGRRGCSNEVVAVSVSGPINSSSRPPDIFILSILSSVMSPCAGDDFSLTFSL